MMCFSRNTNTASSGLQTFSVVSHMLYFLLFPVAGKLYSGGSIVTINIGTDNKGSDRSVAVVLVVVCIM